MSPPPPPKKKKKKKIIFFLFMKYFCCFVPPGGGGGGWSASQILTVHFKGYKFPIFQNSPGKGLFKFCQKVNLSGRDFEKSK